jgi:hypothetical protein
MSSLRDAVLDAQVDSLYRVIRGRVNWDNLIPTCIDLARELEQMTHLKGKQRLELLQATLKFALKESDKTVVEKENLLHVIDTIVPLAMQAAILASKAPILVHSVSRCWKKCVS